MIGEGRHKCNVNLPLAFTAIFSWCSSRVLPLIAILLLALLAVHRLIIFHERNFLDDCYHVYLDMGTNTGIQVVCTCMMFTDRFNFILIQIRKLYQPHLFPKAEVLPVFDRFFGPPADRFSSPLSLSKSCLVFQIRKTVCAVGWEPNWEHTATLDRLQKGFNVCGWRVSLECHASLLRSPDL